MIPDRISAISIVARCPGLHAIRASQDRTGSKAADTGSAVGRIVQLHHEGSFFADAVSQAIHEAPERFPLADLDAAKDTCLRYCADDRNKDVVEPGSCELEVRLTLAPAPEDSTGEPVLLTGHVDQLRRTNAGLHVWDIKHSSKPGLELVHSYAWQLAAYALAVTETLGETCLPGGIIRTTGYTRPKRKPKPPGECQVFYSAPWSLDQCRAMLATLVQHVAWLRNGLVHCHPGPHCAWCSADGPHLCADVIGAIYA